MTREQVTPRSDVRPPRFPVYPRGFESIAAVRLALAIMAVAGVMAAVLTVME